MPHDQLVEVVILYSVIVKGIVNVNRYVSDVTIE